MTRARAALLGAAVVLLVACSNGDSTPAVGSDTRGRVPDDHGVVSSVTLEQVTLDGKRTYDVSDEVRTFSTYDRALQPLLGFENRYVHVGLRKGKVVWLAGIGAVVPGKPPAVYYTGTVREVDEEKGVVFGDGTVLRLADGVEAPGKAAVVQVKIDPSTGLVSGYVR